MYEVVSSKNWPLFMSSMGMSSAFRQRQFPSFIRVRGLISTHKPGQQLPIKDPLRYTRDMWINGAPEVFTADEVVHARQRRLLAVAFSDKATREQEPLVQSHVNHLVKQLRKRARLNEEVDMSAWLNSTTFDIIGDLAFGEPFGCLKAGEYHPWVALVFASVRAVSFMSAIRQFPWLNLVFERLVGRWMRQAILDHQKLAIEKVDRRLKRKGNRGDFFDSILKHSGTDRAMSTDEIYSNSGLLIMAGSETSATALAGCIYHLASTPEVMDRLKDELRSKFQSEEDISFEALADQSYLTAVLQESMRLFPAQPIFTPRIAPKEGIVVAGWSVPANTTLGIYQTVAYHASKNFHNPESFDPSRWLDNPLYAEDRKAVFQPFSVGPNNCIGKQLAYNEMRLIVARLVWNFDFELCNKAKKWTDQKAYWGWQRPPLMLIFKEAPRPEGPE